MEFQEFTISDVFKKIDIKMMNKKARDFPNVQNAEYCIPLLTCQNTNQGFSRYAKRSDCPHILKNVISVAANGTAIAFYQPNEFAILQDAYAIKLKDGTEFDEKTGLYLSIVLNKFLVKNQYCWTNKSGWNKISDKKIWIPVKKDENGKKNIDFKYMRKVIEEMEHEAIDEIKKYLKVSGFDDCELTKEEKNVYDMELVEVAMGEHEKEARKFKLCNLFDSETGDTDIQKKDLEGTGCYVVSAGLTGCGLIGRTEKNAKIISAGTITVDMFGNVFYRDIPYKMVTHARVFALIPKFEIDELVGQYLASALFFLPKKFSYSNMCSWNKIKDMDVYLPIQTEQTGKPIIDPEHKFHKSGFIPDWDFMKNYVKAAEKEVIKEFADEIEKKIEKSKATVG